jgi:hypothetical protein
VARRTDDDDLRIPRGRGLRLTMPQIFRIAMVAVMLVAVIVLQRPCADAVGRFVAGFDPPKPAAPDAGAVETPPGYVRLRADMTEAELRSALEHAKASDAGPASP